MLLKLEAMATKIEVPCTIDIAQQIQSASGTFGVLSNVWKSLKITRYTTMKIFRSNVLSVLTALWMPNMDTHDGHYQKATNFLAPMSLSNY